MAENIELSELENWAKNRKEDPPVFFTTWQNIGYEAAMNDILAQINKVR